ncbi:MAG: RNA polymerase sigma factor (sigma-70 family) [Planctomycetota bacterium]
MATSANTSATARDAKLGVVTPKHRAALWRYLRVLGASSCDAEDLVQDTFLVALRRPEFDDTSAAAVFTFLRTTARHLWLRSNKRTIDERQLQEADEIWDRRCGDGLGDDYVDALQRCVATLPERSRQLLQATYSDGDGRATAAARFGLGVDGVKSALRRLRTWLHDCITKRMQQAELEEEQ